MGFMTMPASQDLSPHSCASAMAPRSQSCHAVGAGDTGLENGEDYSDTQSQHGGRCPPAKPKRHPSTRLSSSSDPRAPHAPPDKSDSGDMSKKVPPLKPKRSPSTQLSFEPPTPCVPPLATPTQGGEGQPQGEEGDDEPVYIEMVGQVITRESQTATPHPVTPVATTPDSDSDQSEAIYEEMKYPLPEDREGHKRLPLKHERLKSSKHHHSSSGISAHLPRPSSSPSCSKPKTESNSKIPAPFPNLLQHRPPLLAFPQPAAASSGVGVQHKAAADRDRDSQLGPAPGLRARSHSTPLPPSSKSTSPYSHHHHHPHPHHRPSHYHHYRKPERGDSPNPNTNNKNGSETFSKSIAQTQTQGSDREAGFHFTSSQAENTTNNLSSQTSASSATTSSSSSSSHSRPHSRSQLHRYHTPHGLPAYKPPSSDSPLLWTYPSVGFRRPPAYDSLRGGSHLPSLHHQGHGDVASKSSTVPGPVQGKAGFMPWDNSGFGDDGSYLPMQRKIDTTLYFVNRRLFHVYSTIPSVIPLSEDEGRAWNGSADALLRIDKEDLGPGHRGGGGHSGIPVRFTGGRGLGHSESLAGMEGGSLGFRALPRGGLPLPCQTFPACRNGELGRLSRSSSTSGVRQVGGSDVQRQSSLPHREVLNQPPTTGGAATSAAQTQRDGKLLEVIERKRCLCKEIKAHRRPEKNLCKQDSMPILPSWRRTPEPRKTGTPPCQRPQAVVWDTAI
uniref:Neuronal tyrosine phosphorylated phosphoinositide-3-kinase adaptor 1 n=1 Tax=Hucho hucho TaxID=62062 RepID=A0A4W5LRL1_9TELE